MKRHLDHVRGLVRQGNYVAAIKELQNILGEASEDAEAHVLIAECYRFLSDRDSADLGLSEQQREESSMAHVNLAVSLSPNDLSMIRRRAQLIEYWHDDDLSKTVAAWSEVLRMDPNDPQALTTIAEVDSRVTPEQRLEIFERVFELAPSLLTSHLNLAVALFHLRRNDPEGLKRARHHASEAARLDEFKKFTRHTESLLRGIEDALEDAE